MAPGRAGGTGHGHRRDSRHRVQDAGRFPLRCGGGRGRLRRYAPAAPPASGELPRPGLRDRIGGGGHLVLESLSGSALRCAEHRVLLLLRSPVGTRLGVVREVRHPTGDPALRQLCGRSFRPAKRHPLRHPDHHRRVRRNGRPLAHRHPVRAQRRRGSLSTGYRPVLRHGQRLPFGRQTTRASRPGQLCRTDVPHRALAPPGRRFHRSTGGGDRHRFLRHSVHPGHRPAGGPSHGFPANPQLQRSRP